MFKSLVAGCALLFSGVVFAQAGTAAKPGSQPAAAPAASSAAAAPAAVHPRVALHTSMGDIVVELFPDKAPKTVDNFLRYVKDKHYDGTVFHRIINDFMIQGGGFTSELKQKPVRAPIPNEANNGVSNLRGTIAMARTGDPNSATAQFFINVVDNNRLDYVSSDNGATWGYCAFGKVTSGLDVVDKMKAVETGPSGPFGRDVPKEAVTLISAELLP